MFKFKAPIPAYLVFSWLAGSLFAQAQNPATALERYQASHHLEKIYISHDKPQYSPGDTIWCQLFLRDGVTHQAFDAAPLVHVDWIGPGGESRHSILLKAPAGSAAFEIPTYAEEEGGIYVIRAYTQHQRNFDPAFFFQKQIRLLAAVPDNEQDDDMPVSDYSVSFFPEGGQMVTGLTSIIAFKARDENGRNINLTGQIVDEKGTRVTGVETIHEGMGQFVLNPGTEARYFLETSYLGIKKKFALPVPSPDGLLLSAKTTSPGKIRLRIESSDPASMAGSMLIGHLRGQVFLSEALTRPQNITLSLPDTAIPSGLLHFTLFDPANRPVCERLVFNRNPQEEIEVDINLDRERHQPKKPIDFGIDLQTASAMAAAIYSVTVYNAELIPEEDQLDIVNYFLLQSDLKGKIRNIGRYFADDDAETRSLRDLLLLTHGWRRFTWSDVMVEESPGIQYPTEESIAIAGRVTKEGKDKPVRADITLTTLSEEAFTSASVTTAEDGLFYFKGFNFSDTTDLLLQAAVHRPSRKKKQKEDEIKISGNRYVDIKLINLHEFPFDSSLSFPVEAVVAEKAEQFVRVAEQNRQIDSIYLPTWAIDLEEITVRARLSPGQIREQAIERKYRERGLFYFSSTEKFLTDNPIYDNFRKTTVFELIRTIVPGATFLRKNGEPKIIYGRLSRDVEAYIALDGRLVPAFALESIDPNNIAIIDVVTGMRADALYGAAPVIALVSKDPEEIAAQKVNPGILNLQHPGYHQAREFYSPNYDRIPLEEQKPDYRTTLYWHAGKIEGNARSKFQFYAGDLEAAYLIRVEGITEDGVPFTATRTFRVAN